MREGIEGIQPSMLFSFARMSSAPVFRFAHVLSGSDTSWSRLA